jgi:aminoglycoside 3-N-acetyltransferase
MPKLTKQSITDELDSLGICRGDIVFVSSDLMRVGYFSVSAEKTMRDWLSIFDELLGPEGTIVVPTYSPSVIRFFQRSEFVYTRDTHSDSGSLANAYIGSQKAPERSLHPTNSCIALGRFAQDIVTAHTHESTAYFPYGKVIENGGKNLMLGTVDEKNCPMTFHYAQEVLGHTSTHPLCGLLETNYLDQIGEKRKFIVRELGGCTRGVHKTWGYHLSKNAVRFGMVGRSLSALVDTRKSLDIFLDLLESNPSIIRCDDYYCISCYGRFRYNGIGVGSFYTRKLIRAARKRIFW